jgi:aminoglycoside phosphotransferase (APT) family kinase protein
MRDQLEAWIGEQAGEPVTVTSLRRITTGHSRGNWRLELADGSRFVVRVEQGGVFGTSGAVEFEFMRAVGRLGFPVARVRWLEPTGSVVGQPFFVMDFVDGGVAAEREDRTLAPELATDFVRRLDELHHLEWAAELDGPPPDEAIHGQIERWADVYRTSTPYPMPLLEEGRAWLHHHAPHLDRVALVHGDPGPGNFVHDGQRVLAFTDWEFSHFGDPIEDWAFLLSMRGARTMQFDAWIELIRRETGIEVSDEQMHYWKVFNFFKGACANTSCLRAFAGANPAPNMLLIGTVLQQTFMRQMSDLVSEGRA